jgi:16S rRNA (guanine966-N2)-methyltransferase
MRITGGRYKGRRITCPPGIIRPAMDRMRESLFAILGDLTSCSFLDLFSGSGVVGIEAASRGASPVVFVEKDFRKKETLLKNVSIIDSEVEIHLMPIERFIKKTKKSFDVIFIDPPFRRHGKNDLLMLVRDSDLLGKESRLILHAPREEKLLDVAGNLSLYDKRSYGRSILYFFRLQSSKKK